MNLYTMVNDINLLDESVAESQFMIAKYLSIIKEKSLYADMGYRSFALFVKEQFYFSSSTADRFASLYNQYERLSYTKAQFIRLMQQIHWRTLEAELRPLKKRVSAKTLERKIEERHRPQVNICFRSDNDKKRFVRVLERYGIDGTEKYRKNIPEALMALLDDYETLKRNAEHSTLKPKKTEKTDKPEKQQAKKSASLKAVA